MIASLCEATFSVSLGSQTVALVGDDDSSVGCQYVVVGVDCGITIFLSSLPTICSPEAAAVESEVYHSTRAKAGQ